MAECDGGVRAAPPAGAVGLDADPEGDAAHLLARALPGAGRAHPRRDARHRAHDRHHRRVPGRDRGRLRRHAVAGRPRRLRPRVHVRLLGAPRHRGGPHARPGARAMSGASGSSGWSSASSTTRRPGTPRSSAPSRRCSSRGRAAPTRRSCAGGRAAGRPSTSRATAAAGSLVDVTVTGSTSQTLSGPPGRARRRLDPMAVIAIFGPTASGKSAVALELAELVGGEIVSCDAMQLYRGLPILTNQPTAADRERVAAPSGRRVGAEPRGLGRRVRGRWPTPRSTTILGRGRVPIVCGGSGLYLRAALADMPLPPRGAGRRPRRAPSGCTTSAGRPARTRTLAAVDAPRRGRRAPERPPPRRARARARASRGIRWPRSERAGSGRPDTRHADRRGRPGRSRPAADRRPDRGANRGDVRGGRGRRGARGARRSARSRARQSGSTGSRTSRRCLPARSTATRRRGALEARTRRYAKRQRTWMRRLPGVAGRRRGDRDPRAVAARTSRGGREPAGRARRGPRGARRARHRGGRRARGIAVAARSLAVAAGDFEAWTAVARRAARRRRAPARHARLRAASRRPRRRAAS